MRIFGFERADRLSPRQEAYYARILEACGAQTARRDWLYEIPVPASLHDWEKMARRFGAQAALRSLNRETCAQAAQIAGLQAAQMARTFGALPRPRIAIARVNGALAGYMVVLPNGRLFRLAEVRVLPQYQRRGAIAALICAVAPHLGRVVEAGVIDEENRASALLAERAGGNRVAGFAFYRLTKI